LEEGEQRQQQQDDNYPEGEIAQIRVHRSSFVAARIAALFPLGRLKGAPSRRLNYNLGAAGVDAKGTSRDYLAHHSAIPAQIMAVESMFFHGG
jgi:hypothetical protein